MLGYKTCCSVFVFAFQWLTHNILFWDKTHSRAH